MVMTDMITWFINCVYRLNSVKGSLLNSCFSLLFFSSLFLSAGWLITLTHSYSLVKGVIYLDCCFSELGFYQLMCWLMNWFSHCRLLLFSGIIFWSTMPQCCTGSFVVHSSSPTTASTWPEVFTRWLRLWMTLRTQTTSGGHSWWCQCYSVFILSSGKLIV